MIEKGNLIITVNPTDGKIDIKLKTLRANLIIQSLTAIAMFILMLVFFQFEIALVAGVVLAILAAVTYYKLHDSFYADIAPIKVYSNGVDHFESPLMKLRGMSGFIEKSRIESIHVDSYQFVGEMNPRNHDQVMAFKNNKNVTLWLKNGKKKQLGKRFSHIVDEMAERMGKTWSVPVKQDEIVLGNKR